CHAGRSAICRVAVAHLAPAAYDASPQRERAEGGRMSTIGESQALPDAERALSDDKARAERAAGVRRARRAAFNLLIRLVSVAILPLIVPWAGYEQTTKVIILFMFAFFPMVTNTYQSVKAVDPKLVEVGCAFRCNEGQLCTNIDIPASLPFIVTRLLLALGRG